MSKTKTETDQAAATLILLGAVLGAGEKRKVIVPASSASKGVAIVDRLEAAAVEGGYTVEKPDWLTVVVNGGTMTVVPDDQLAAYGTPDYFLAQPPLFEGLWA